MAATPITLNGEAFVLVPKAEYDRLLGLPDGCVEAEPFLSEAIGDHLRRIREAAGMTQVALAKRLGRSQAFVCGTERGTTRVGERYLRSVLEACGAEEEEKRPAP